MATSPNFTGSAEQQHVLATLPAALRPYVQEVYELPYPSVPEGSYEIPVSANITPILNVTLTGRARATLSDGPSIWLPAVVLSGPQPNAYRVEVHGALRGFYVTFAAAGPLALLGVRRYDRGESGALPSLADLVRPALAPAAHAYVEALLSAPDFGARAALTEAFLLDALRGAPAADLDEAAFLQPIVDAIGAAGGRIRVETLARRFGVSLPTLRRHFTVLGMPPKRFAEVIRFRHAHAFLHSKPGTTWSDVVDRFGYADQSHFVRAYHRFAGIPPTRWDTAARPIDERMGIASGPPGEPR